MVFFPFDADNGRLEFILPFTVLMEPRTCAAVENRFLEHPYGRTRRQSNQMIFLKKSTLGSIKEDTYHNSHDSRCSDHLRE